MKMILHGGTYVDARLVRDYSQGTKEGWKLDWADIPACFRITEEDVRKSNGARMYGTPWIEKHLTWYGCAAAVPAGSTLWAPCGHKPMPNGYCRRHKGRAATN